VEWFSLSLLCALSLASTDAFTKMRLQGYSGSEMMLVRFLVTGVLLAPLLLYFPLPSAPWAFWAWMALLVPLELLAIYLYMQAIRDAPLYQTLPYLAFTPVFIILTGWWVLDERVSLLGAIGIVLVVVGAYLLNIDKLHRNGRRLWYEPLRAIVYRQSSRRMLMVAVIYSLTSVGGKAAMLYVGTMNFAVFYFVVLGAAAFLAVALLRPVSLRVLTRQPAWHLLIGALFALMVVTHFLALSKVEAAYMIAVKRTSLLFGILYGAWLFHEKQLARNFSSAALMVVGVALILLA
jgi:drug/metabolite transporter (DMT)-like permease